MTPRGNANAGRGPRPPAPTTPRGQIGASERGLTGCLDVWCSIAQIRRPARTLIAALQRPARGKYRGARDAIAGMQTFLAERRSLSHLDGPSSGSFE
jgi:hypothetical protein